MSPVGRVRALGRQTFASLGVPGYRRFFVVLAVAMTGFWMRIATLNWLVYELTGSNEKVGVIVTASLLPWVLVAPIGGALADRHDQRTVMARVYLAMALVTLLLGAGVYAGVVGWGLLLAAALATGCLSGLDPPARHALLVRLVGRASLPNATGLNAACFHLTAAIGPLIAGLVLETTGPGVCLVLGGLALLPMAFVAPRLEAAPQVRSTGRARHQIVQGFRYVVRHRLTAALMLGVATSLFFLWSYRVLMPAIAKDVYGFEETGYGLLMGLIGAGAFAGALWVANQTVGRDPMRLARFVWIGCGGVALVAWARHPVLAGAGLLVAGFCQIAFIAAANATIQEHVPDAIRGRVMSLWAVTFGVAYPLGSAVMGAAADRFTMPWAMTGGAALMLAISATFAFVRRAPRPVVSEDGKRSRGDDALPPDTGRSVGAMSRGIEIPGSEYRIRPNQTFEGAEPFKWGSDIGIADDLVREFGGTKNGWRMYKKHFDVESDLTGEIVSTEVHWFQHHGVGRVRFHFPGGIDP